MRLCVSSGRSVNWDDNWPDFWLFTYDYDTLEGLRILMKGKAGWWELPRNWCVIMPL